MGFQTRSLVLLLCHTAAFHWWPLLNNRGSRTIYSSRWLLILQSLPREVTDTSIALSWIVGRTPKSNCFRKKSATYVQGQPLASDKQVLVLVTLPHAPHWNVRFLPKSNRSYVVRTLSRRLGPFRPSSVRFTTRCWWESTIFVIRRIGSGVIWLKRWLYKQVNYRKPAGHIGTANWRPLKCREHNKTVLGNNIHQGCN